jgi:hypothetical protein
MSHTSRLPDGWIAIHNGDFSGDTLLRHDGEDVAYVPFHIIKALVSQYVRDQRIARLEDMTDEEVLQ